MVKRIRVWMGEPAKATEDQRYWWCNLCDERFKSKHVERHLDSRKHQRSVERAYGDGE